MQEQRSRRTRGREAGVSTNRGSEEMERSSAWSFHVKNPTDAPTSRAAQRRPTMPGVCNSSPHAVPIRRRVSIAAAWRGAASGSGGGGGGGRQWRPAPPERVARIGNLRLGPCRRKLWALFKKQVLLVYMREHAAVGESEPPMMASRCGQVQCWLAVSTWPGTQPQT